MIKKSPMKEVTKNNLWEVIGNMWSPRDHKYLFSINNVFLLIDQEYRLLFIQINYLWDDHYETKCFVTTCFNFCSLALKLCKIAKDMFTIVHFFFTVIK